MNPYHSQNGTVLNSYISTDHRIRHLFCGPNSRFGVPLRNTIPDLEMSSVGSKHLNPERNESKLEMAELKLSMSEKSG
jgi:hypothetical protein